MRTTQILLIVALVFFVSIAFIEAKREGPQRSERKSVNKVVPPRFLEEVNIPKHKDPSQLRIDESPLKSLEGVNLVENILHKVKSQHGDSVNKRSTTL